MRSLILTSSAFCAGLLLTAGPVAAESVVWVAETGGAFDDGANWQAGVSPTDSGPSQVSINPDFSQTIDGPAGRVVVETLRFGEGAGRAELKMQGGAIAVETADPNGLTIFIGENGVLSGQGTIENIAGGQPDIFSFGRIEGAELVFDGVFLNAGTYEGGGVVRGGFANGIDGEIEIGSGETLQLLDGRDDPNGPFGGHLNFGEMQVFGGELESQREMTNSGRIVARDSNLDFEGGLENVDEILFSGDTNDVEGDVTNSGFPDNPALISNAGGGVLTFYDAMTNEGTIETIAGGRTVFLDSYTGSGSLTGGGDVFMRGEFAPGSSPGVVDLGGNLTLSGTSIFELGGTALGAFDQVDVSGTAMLGGDLIVTNIDDFLAKPGDRFELIIASQILGGFDSITLPGLDAGRFRIFQTDTTFGIAAVPLPAAGWMLIAGVGALTALRRRGAG